MARPETLLRSRSRPDASSYAAVGTDTRTLAEGALFVALRGEHFDGHRFL
ncbi:MAG: Mur ligase domain-containing protein, partial [Gemmatimonadota bacterium]